MDDEPLCTIGILADRTGLSVKTIRFYSDTGIVPPTEHSPAGYRLYDSHAQARLELVRTLHALDIDLTTVRAILARETSVSEVATAHADALDVRIRTLRLRRAVLRAVADRESNQQEMQLMHELVNMSESERHRLVHDFVDDTFGTVDANPAVVELLRSSMPDLPAEPSTEQVTAWMDLVALVRDEAFRAAVRRMAEYQAKERAAGDDTGLHHDLTEVVGGEVTAALDAGIGPDSAAARSIVERLAGRYAETFGRADDDALRSWILERLEVADDPRVVRYWQLVSTVNGRQAPPDLGPVLAWFARALREALRPR